MCFLLRIFFFISVYIGIISEFTYGQQSSKIKGIVLETDNKGSIQPIAGAVVYWAGSVKTILTDSLGMFEIERPTTSNKLVITAFGFKNDTVIIDKQSYVKVLLISKTKLQELIVEYERKTSEISFIDPLKVTLMTEKELFKAACCNLSESFETNPSVDVNYTDALTGTKQIQMLGLTGQYVQITENAMPSVRGIATNYGLNYLPGTWINNIQVSKGVGSVVNGYEPIAGQINTNLHMPDENEKFFLNLYASEGGRTEGNFIVNSKINNKFSAGVLGHYSNYALRMDRNEDGFLDNPLGTQLNGKVILKYNNRKGLLIQGGLRALTDVKTGGEFNYRHALFDTSVNATLYGTRVNANRTDAWMKAGYNFERKIYKSIGIQVKGSIQNFENYFGKNLYDANQQNLYANIIYQTIINNTNHKIRMGLSTNNDVYREQLFNYTLLTGNRMERTHGVFTEYTFTHLAKFTLVVGLRADQFNFYDLDFGSRHIRKYIYTPRIHARYAFNEKTVLRASAGSGWRPANPVADNVGLLVSSRQWIFTHYPFLPQIDSWKPLTSYAIFSSNPENAYNIGLNLTHDFKLNYRNGTVSAEYYYTQFRNQLIVDRDYNPQSIYIYGDSRSTHATNFQIQIDYSPVRRMDVRLAYRYFNVNTRYINGWLQAPMIAKNRGFLNVAYKTKSNWEFDLTTQYISSKRLPDTQKNPEAFRFNKYSPAYYLVNTQITKNLKKAAAIYVGIENLFDFKQFNPILDAGNPFGAFFDAGMIWGPVFGRMIYTGLRYRF